jgi:2-polyprenyl-3-methyl-5-hydroxy-6-metoxy-1,4-benzoquinol methylase
MSKWIEAQKYEKDWHINQQFNEYNENTKQYIYASKMGLDEFKTNYYNIIGWDFGNKRVLDVGGSGNSLLLKAKGDRTVIDPIKPPEWMLSRYEEAKIKFIHQKGESEIKGNYDIGLIYNVLQHTENPKIILENMLECCKEIRIFEWIDAGISEGHIHNLKEEDLNKWLGGVGKVEMLKEFPAVGKVFFGIFPSHNKIS